MFENREKLNQPHRSRTSFLLLRSAGAQRNAQFQDGGWFKRHFTACGGIPETQQSHQTEKEK